MRLPIAVLAAVTVFTIGVAARPSAQDAPAGRGGGRQGGAGRGAPVGGNRGATFPAQQRPPGDPAAIARGSGLYGVYCRACHGADLRGGDQGGPNLLRSDVVLNDQAGELIGPVVQNGRQGPTGAMPPFALMPDDLRALAEYIHSVAATMRGQGNPPAGPAPVLNVLVGDPAAGQRYFSATCAGCHSPAGDLRGIGSRLPDPTALQNFWLSAGGGLGRGGGRGGAPVPAARQVTAVVTAPGRGQVEGALVRLDDFYVVLRLADGTERSFRRTGESPNIEVRDPLEPHKKLLPMYTDKDIHDVTAYLATLK
jgi:cytochrome c oxidase cbb3-type subunit III